MRPSADSPESRAPSGRCGLGATSPPQFRGATAFRRRLRAEQRIFAARADVRRQPQPGAEVWRDSADARKEKLLRPLRPTPEKSSEILEGDSASCSTVRLAAAE